MKWLQNEFVVDKNVALWLLTKDLTVAEARAELIIQIC